jgi:hypothetical protein
VPRSGTASTTTAGCLPIQDDALAILISSIEEPGNSGPVVRRGHGHHTGRRRWKPVVPTVGHPLACHETSRSPHGQNDVDGGPCKCIREQPLARWVSARPRRRHAGGMREECRRKAGNRGRSLWLQGVGAACTSCKPVHCPGHARRSVPRAFAGVAQACTPSACPYTPPGAVDPFSLVFHARAY